MSKLDTAEIQTVDRDLLGAGQDKHQHVGVSQRAGDYMEAHKEGNTCVPSQSCKIGRNPACSPTARENDTSVLTVRIVRGLEGGHGFWEVFGRRVHRPAVYAAQSRRWARPKSRRWARPKSRRWARPKSRRWAQPKSRRWARPKSRRWARPKSRRWARPKSRRWAQPRSRRWARPKSSWYDYEGDSQQRVVWGSSRSPRAQDKRQVECKRAPMRRSSVHRCGKAAWARRDSDNSAASREKQRADRSDNSGARERSTRL
ncbi:hypothetical protein PLICRDRAFT_533753 [Plicaturopsis crispa FD-325 SS-3]|nr:hypothetical protein PLICRDRAFT_533753 [Plicaturopsis crispa FD-325 SS-3]